MKRVVCLLLVGLLLGGLGPRGRALEVPGESALLMEAATGTVLFEQNAHQALAPASVTKVMTLLLIMEAIDGGSLSWSDTVTASETAAAKGGSQVYLKVGESMTVEDMVKAIAVSSANDCACAMAEHIAGSEAAFVEAMNRRARELGMEHTHFVNCTGLDDAPEAREHLTCAYDIARMSRQLLVEHPDIKKFTTIWMDTLRQGTFGLSNTNKLVRFYPGATGLKTGFTASAGYCLSASAQREDMELIAVVMGAKTSAQRFHACKTMLDHGFAQYALVRPEPPQAQVRVELGTQDSVTATLDANAALLIEKSQKSLVQTQVALEKALPAPISQGQRLGTLTLTAGGQTIAQLPLVAQNAVARLTYGQLYLRLLRRLCMAR